MRAQRALLTIASLIASAPGSAAPGLREAGEALNRGEYAKAASQAAQILATARRERDCLGEAQSLNYLGLARLYLGEYAAARAAIEQALEADARCGYAEGLVTHNYNLGNVYYFQGIYQQAFEHYQAALDQADRHRSEPWWARRRHVALANLAMLNQKLGRNERALEMYRGLRSGAGPLPPAEEGQLLVNEGVLYRRLGDPSKALESYRAAQRLFARNRHTDAEIGVLKNIGIALASDFGDVSGAVKHFQQALAIARATANAQDGQIELYYAEALRRAGRTGEARVHYESAERLAKRSGAVDDEWRATYGLGRIAEQQGARDEAMKLYREAAERVEAMRSRIQDASLKREFLAGKAEVYDAIVDLLLDTPVPPAAEIFEWMERGRARTLQDAFPAPPKLGAVRERLAAGDVLLEYFHGRRHSAVLAASRDGARVATIGELPPRESLEALISGESWRAQSSIWGQALFGPVADAVATATRVLIVAAREQAIPFDALAMPGGSELLIERADVVVLPSAALLVRGARAAEPAFRSPWSRVLLAVADPAGGPANVAGAEENWPPLPHAREEARQAQSQLGGRGALLLGGAATKPAFFSEAGRAYPMIHLATHAVADPLDGERSRIVFAPSSPRSRYDYLFLREITGLDLRSTNLVTLAACDTGSGRVVEGEGADSLSRALLGAGAGSVLATLWRVDDRATAEFMTLFYRAAGRGDTFASAARYAKLRFLTSGGAFAHPKYWAGFSLSGDPGARGPRVVRWWWLGAAAILATALSTAWWAWRQTKTDGL